MKKQLNARQLLAKWLKDNKIKKGTKLFNLSNSSEFRLFKADFSFSYKICPKKK